MVLKFMDNIKNDQYYIEKVIGDIETIQKYLGNKSFEEFTSDELLIDAIMFRLVQMIESIKNISMELKSRTTQIPWGKIMGFRNGIVHEYGATDYVTVYEIITGDLETLKHALEESL